MDASELPSLIYSFSLFARCKGTISTHVRKIDIIEVIYKWLPNLLNFSLLFRRNFIFSCSTCFITCFHFIRFECVGTVLSSVVSSSVRSIFVTSDNILCSTLYDKILISTFILCQSVIPRNDINGSRSVHLCKI